MEFNSGFKGLKEFIVFLSWKQTFQLNSCMTYESARHHHRHRDKYSSVMVKNVCATSDLYSGCYVCDVIQPSCRHIAIISSVNRPTSQMTWKCRL